MTELPVHFHNAVQQLVNGYGHALAAQQRAHDAEKAQMMARIAALEAELEKAKAEVATLFHERMKP